MANKVNVRKLDDGTHELGAEIDGVFVPFASHPQSYVDTIVQAGKNAEANERDAADEDEPGA